jgi:cytochrome c553
MFGSMILATVVGGGCRVPAVTAVAAPPYAAIAAVPVVFTWRVGEDEHQQQLIERLIAVEEQNAAAIAALARSSANAGELGPTTQRSPLDAYVAQSCVGCHSAQRKDGDVDLSGKIDKELWRRAAKEMAKGTMPKRGAKPSAPLVEAALERAFEE